MADGSSTVGSASLGQAGSLSATRDLLAQLDQVKGMVAQSDPALARTVSALVQAAQKPELLDDQVFRTRLAYATQDVERHAGRLQLPAPLRDEMSALANTYPGLQHDKVRNLLSSTSIIEDRSLIRDIRKLAADTAGLGDAQRTADVAGKADAIEARLRLAPAAAGTTVSQSPGEQGD